LLVIHLKEYINDARSHERQIYVRPASSRRCDRSLFRNLKRTLVTRRELSKVEFH